MEGQTHLIKLSPYFGPAPAPEASIPEGSPATAS
jgi:hypothetical protein